MAFIGSIEELHDSPQVSTGETSSATRTYWILNGSGTYENAYEGLAGEVPAEMDDGDGVPMFLKGLHVEPIDGYDQWRGTARYSSAQNWQAQLAQGDTDALSYSAGVEQINLRHAISTTIYKPAGETEPSADTAINVRADGSVDGIEISTPTLEFTATRIRAATYITTFRAIVMTYVGTVNLGTFNGMVDGSVLFLGAKATRRNEDEYTCDYRFAYSQPLGSTTIGTITGVTKKGWEYLEVYYEEEVDATFGRIVQQPRLVKVHKVYNQYPFSSLGLGL